MSLSSHAKRITASGVAFIAYSVGNAVGPFISHAKHKPRNKALFATISDCSVARPSCYSSPGNTRFPEKRDEEAAAGADKQGECDEVYITVMEGGRVAEKKVNRVRSSFLPSVPLRPFGYPTGSRDVLANLANSVIRNVVGTNDKHHCEYWRHLSRGGFLLAPKFLWLRGRGWSLPDRPLIGLEG